MARNKNIYAAGLLCLAFACLASSCKIGKSYVRPELNLPGQIGERQDSLTLADRKWWEVYTDVTLQNLIRKSLEHNKDMLIAAARVKEMAARKRIKVAELLPQVDGRISGERESTNYGGRRNLANDDTFEGKLVFAGELDLWGNLRWARDASLAEYFESVEAQRALQMTIVAEVAQAYYELVALDNELAIVKQTLEARREGVRLAKIRFEGGLTSETSYQQAQVELAKAETMVPELERKIDLKESEISLLAGGFPSHINRGIQPENVNLPDTLPVGLPSSLMERRPDIRKAEQELIAANAAIGVAYTNLFPRISLTANLGAESDVFSENKWARNGMAN